MKRLVQTNGHKAPFLRASIRSRWFDDQDSRDFIGLRCVREPER